MADLSVRKLKRNVYEGLRLRAAKHGVSMEEEVRRIIAEAVSAPPRLGDLFVQYFGPKHGLRTPLPKRPRVLPRPLDFTK